MNPRIPLRLAARLHHSGVPARIGSLMMLLQRSPLMKLLPEARVMSTSGFSDAVIWTALSVTGLGAFNSVSRATSIQQNTPTLGASTVTVTGGSSLNFAFQVVNAPSSTISSFVITGDLPDGLFHNDFKSPTARTSNISGTALETGSFPITITAWEFPDNSGRSVSGNFTINVTAPPAPTISAQPQGGNFTPGSFVSLTATQTAGYSFVWKKNGQPLPDDTFVLVSPSAPRRFLVPITNPTNNWRSGVAFNDSTWTPVSGGIGYDLSLSPVDYNPHIATGGNVRTLMNGTGRPTSALIRIPFTMTESATISSLKLRVQSDDGFVAWLNGTEIAYQNRFATVNFDSDAAALAVDANADDFREFNVSRFITALRSGENLLAVQAMNESNTSSDFLFNCELLGGIDATSTRRLILPSVQAANAGSYTVTITNSTGSVTSDPAVIVLPPSIESHPGSVSINSGETTILSVLVTTSPPWTYQWFRGVSGDETNPVNGATGTTFTTPPLTATSKFWVRVTNPAGSADSNAAEVTVSAPALPPVLSAPPESVTVDAGATAQFSVGATGDPPLSYQWYTGASGDINGLIPGADAATFTTLPLNAPFTCWVRVRNPAGPADSLSVTAFIRDPFLTWQRDRFSSEELELPAISGPAADPDGDGVINDHEYVFGTQPKTAQPAPLLSIGLSDETIPLTFIALKAAGPGYAGRVRHYAIETTGDVSAGPWTPLPLFEDVIGNDQAVTATITPGASRTFCRLRIRLTP